MSQKDKHEKSQPARTEKAERTQQWSAWANCAASLTRVAEFLARLFGEGGG